MTTTLPVAQDIDANGRTIPWLGRANPTSAALQSAAATDGNGTDFDITGMATVVVTVSPTSYTGTVTFKASEDGTIFDNILGTKLGTTTVASSVANPGSTKSIWIFQTAGLKKFRAPLSSSGGTSVTVTGHASPFPNAVPVGSTIGTAVIQANSGQATTATADGATAANILLAATGKYNGATIDRERIAKVFKTFAAQSITANTAVTIWTPASGKKFRLLAYSLSLSVDGYLIFKDDTAVIINGPLVLAKTPANSPPMGNGILSATADNALKIDVSASGAVSGWVAGVEE